MASWASPAPFAISMTSTTLPWGTPSSAWMTTRVFGVLLSRLVERLLQLVAR